MKLSIIIPCYNESDNIPLILEKFALCIDGEDMEVVLVNNGSTDNSAVVLEELLPKYTFARTVLVPVNQGYGYGILQGLKSASAEFIGWTHADMQTDPADVVKAYHLLEADGWNSKLFIKGNRKGRSLFDQFFTSGMSFFETLYLGKWLYDINAQPNIFPRVFFESWQNPPNDFSLDLYALYMARIARFDVHRISVKFPPRVYGESKWNNGTLKAKWKFIKRTLDFSKKLKKEGIR
ncbi:MAG: glycosyltransferase family 2 protein [Treponema sp.]